ncbi:PREDICTED: uncharacterized protein LOC101297502 [Fragaria vesca subsp. vesca]|uniref:uncharacterized protein LOC101297502 n=1 Tax=Fragaria vesca subsp. vesca TaxID=101020 RepID=UPI0002C31AA6|nr:PREDICTED: uncharacterized protein LOC101297502 [Fragaria vesca subsp. vesca]
MASMITVPSNFPALRLPTRFPVRKYNCTCVVAYQNATKMGLFISQHSLFTRAHEIGSARLSRPIYAAGLEASIAEETLLRLKTTKIVVESQDDNIIQVRVDVSGDETQKVFDQVLTNLARTAPPVPGFRRQKGGKTSKVPKSFLLDILGKERVTNFVIQELVSSALADYVKQENLTVKENKINTTQSAEELQSSFTPGNEFGFNATIELEKAEMEKPSDE